MSRTILVIGAGPGIGVETARRFADEGYNIVLASRSPAKLEPLLADLRDRGVMVTTEIVDAAKGASVSSLVEQYGEQISVLLYNVGVIRFGPTVDQLTPDSLDEDIQIDLSSALRAIKAAVPGMAGNGGGTILLTGGAITDSPHPLALTLSAGKAGLRASAQALFAPLKEKNVHLTVLTVNANVQPGSDEARGIADAYWQIHSSAPEQWTWERRYPAETRS